jgi:hypothetical protein
VDVDLSAPYLCNDSCDQRGHCADKGFVYKDIELCAMRKFNDSDYELVKKYESHFERAIKSRYCSGLLQDDLKVISRVYRETLNRQANLSCGGCVLQMLVSVGRLYNVYKKELETKIKEESKDVQEDKIKVQDSKGRVGKKSNNKQSGGAVGSEGDKQRRRRSTRAGGSKGDDRKEQDQAPGVVEAVPVPETGQQE